jgi:hypothetical protein
MEVSSAAPSVSTTTRQITTSGEHTPEMLDGFCFISNGTLTANNLGNFIQKFSSGCQ